jgi:Protein of unknown function (DUF5818)
MLLIQQPPGNVSPGRDLQVTAKNCSFGERMRSIQLTTLGTVLLASALPVVGAVLVIVDHPHTVSNNVPELIQSELHLDVRTLPGKISRKAGKFIFREDHRGTVYSLDDQKEAGNFSGKAVLITGTIDSSANLVHVRKIEPTFLFHPTSRAH